MGFFRSLSWKAFPFRERLFPCTALTLGLLCVVAHSAAQAQSSSQTQPDSKSAPQQGTSPDPQQRSTPAPPDANLPLADPQQTKPAPVVEPPDSPIPARPAYLPPKTKTHKKISVVPGRDAPPPIQVTQPVVAAAPTKEHPFVARNPYDGTPVVTTDQQGSAYIPVDSWMYPALLRLYSLGYLDTAFVSLRPWTRRSTLHMLEQTESDVLNGGNEEAMELLGKLEAALESEPDNAGTQRRGFVYGVEQAYVGIRQVGGPVLRDSFHVGQTFVNDYGRPYSTGFNSYNGFSTLTEKGPFSLYVRAEYQHAPHYTGYTFDQASALSLIDEIPYVGANVSNINIPQGIQPAQNHFRVLEANLSGHLYGHEISFGKSDAWIGPGLGGAMPWSNNAENMYSFRFNRVEPLYIPGVSRVFGNFRYDFMVGSLKGHTYPNSPYAHSESIAVTLLKQFEFAAQRTIIFGGHGHAPVNLHTFLKGFFSVTDTTDALKNSRDDPGARFSSVQFSWRIPVAHNLATLYTDSITHDDVFPLAAPRRAGWRPGLNLSRLPGAPKLDLRVEATYTDYVTTKSERGTGNYWEVIQRQGYTQKGFLLGDWIGREAKGGNATLSYHLSGNEWISLGYLRKKNGKDFIPGGTTQDDYRVDLVKRLRPDVELNAWFQHERWIAPFVRPGQQTNNTGSFQVKWYPRLHSTNDLF